jgi:CheY-like chemotaxis protein
MTLTALFAKISARDPTVFPACEVLRMATIEGAQAIGLGDEIGSLGAGKQADLVLWRKASTPYFVFLGDLAYNGDKLRQTILGGDIKEQTVSQGHVLIVDDDQDLSNILRDFFNVRGYRASVASNGNEALDVCRRDLPQIVILEVALPDIDGYQVCQRLKSNLRTSHIPIIFLSYRDDRADRIAGLKLGADDYITKPFDIEYLYFRVQNAVKRARWENLANPLTSLPSGKLVEEQLAALPASRSWAVLYTGINHLEAFNRVYEYGQEDVLRFMAIILTDGINAYGTPDDFVGHVRQDEFIVITDLLYADAIKNYVVTRFNSEVYTFYRARDRDLGYVQLKDRMGVERREPFMSLVVGIVTAETGHFDDVRGFAGIAAAARRQAGYVVRL